MKEQFKLLITTKEGLFSWFIANIITSLHWAIPFFFGWVLGDSRLIALAGSLWALGLSPFIPLFIVNIFIAFRINKFIQRLK